MVQDFLRVSHAPYVAPSIAGFLTLICLSLLSLLRARRNSANVLFAAICFLGALINIDVALVSLIPDKELALRIERVIYFFFVFSFPVYIQFVHAFLGIIGRRGWELTAYLSAVALFPFIPTDQFITGFYRYSFGIVARGGPVFHVFSALAALGVGYCLLTLFLGMKRAEDNQQKNRIKYIFGGTGLSALMICLNILPVSGFAIYPMSNLTFLPVIFLAFGVLKYDLLDMGELVRRGTIYFILTTIFAVFSVLVLYSFPASLGADCVTGRIALPFVLAGLIVLLFNPLKEKVRSFSDTVLFKGRYDYRRLLQQVSEELTLHLKYGQIRDLLTETILAALQVSHVSLVLHDEQRDCFAPFANGGDGAPLFDRNHPVVARLEEAKKPIDKSALAWREEGGGEADQLAALFTVTNASLLVPMIVRGRLLGVIAIGQKKTGWLFVEEDVELLATIANQAAIALENARIYGDLEQLNAALEKKVEQRTAALRRALAEREKAHQQLIQSESLAAVGQLVAGTAHELNNPLASASSLIQTSVERMQGEGGNAETREEIVDDLLFSLKELKRAADIVRSLLDVSRQTQVYVESVDINTAVEDALRVLHNHSKHLAVAIEKHLAEDLPRVEGNFANLGQVFINVIKNAFQALPGGRGQVVLATRYDREADRVVVECSDTGEGMPETRIKDIFKPFFTTKEVGKGTGLGLYISHEIVKKHGGSISVVSALGKGSVFTIELPCRRNGT